MNRAKVSGPLASISVRTCSSRAGSLSVGRSPAGPPAGASRRIPASNRPVPFIGRPRPLTGPPPTGCPDRRASGRRAGSGSLPPGRAGQRGEPGVGHGRRVEEVRRIAIARNRPAFLVGPEPVGEQDPAVHQRCVPELGQSCPERRGPVPVEEGARGPSAVVAGRARRPGGRTPAGRAPRSAPGPGSARVARARRLPRPSSGRRPRSRPADRPGRAGPRQPIEDDGVLRMPARVDRSSAPAEHDGRAASRGPRRGAPGDAGRRRGRRPARPASAAGRCRSRSRPGAFGVGRHRRRPGCRPRTGCWPGRPGRHRGRRPRMRRCRRSWPAGPTRSRGPPGHPRKPRPAWPPAVPRTGARRAARRSAGSTWPRRVRRRPRGPRRGDPGPLPGVARRAPPPALPAGGR